MMKQRQQVSDDLLALINRFAAESLLEEIADGDSQAMPEDTPKHLSALHELRDVYDWRLSRQSGNSWYPREPIELISYAADDHSLQAQVFCNALLMVADLEGATGGEFMHFRWFHAPGEAWYRALSDPWGPALLSAFAELHAEVSELERDFWNRPDAMGQWIETQEDDDG